MRYYNNASSLFGITHNQFILNYQIMTRRLHIRKARDPWVLITTLPVADLRASRHGLQLALLETADYKCMPIYERYPSGPYYCRLLPGLPSDIQEPLSLPLLSLTRQRQQLPAPRPPVLTFSLLPCFAPGSLSATISGPLDLPTVA